MKRIYIAGPMSGWPDNNYPAFNTKAAELRAEGWAVENPAENPVPECGTWLGYMRMALRQLALCDAIYLLAGHQTSRGATIERRLAEAMGFEVVHEQADHSLGKRWRHDGIVKNMVPRHGRLLQAACHNASLHAGWWHTREGADTRANPMCFSQKLRLIHSEISEAMEGDRKGLKDDKLPHRDMREVELADAAIRIFDLAGAYGMDLGAAMAEKMAYNATRADHKPGAREAAGGKSY